MLNSLSALFFSFVIFCSLFGIGIFFMFKTFEGIQKGNEWQRFGIASGTLISLALFFSMILFLS